MNTKSRAVLLSDVLDGILIDVERVYPKERHEWRKDSIRLHSIANRSELWFFTITLPAWSKNFTLSLEKGSYQPLSGPHTRPARGEVFPKLFSGLFAKIFTNEGALRVDADTTAIRFLQTLLCLGKKLRIRCDDQIVVNAVQSFVEVEEGVRHPTLNWGSDVLHHDSGLSLTGDGVATQVTEGRGLWDVFDSPDPALLSYFGAIQSVSDRIFSSFGSPYGELEPRHGPGAISDRGLTGSKYQFPNWPDKLERCFPSSEFGHPNLRYWIQPVDGKELRFRNQSVPSRLIAVPKTQKAPRLIASEPSANMWMQQALRKFLELSTAKSPLANCVDFRNQRGSGDLALKSSLTKSHATIDLSDASDRLSCWLIERLFRRNRDLLDSFNAVRTDIIEIRRSEELRIPKDCPKLMKLKKFSTQGSALTFPVQTLVFSVIAIGAIIADRSHVVTAETIRRTSKEVRVFGDDIIVPNAHSGSVIRMLTELGLKVNTSKTFSEGNFRESCGVDGYMGVDVTPTYVLEPYDKSKPTSIASVVECSNNLFKKGFYHAAEHLRKTLPRQLRDQLAVVGIDSGAFGLIDVVGTGVNQYRSRYNTNLQRREVSVLALSTRAPKTKARGDFALHQYFTENPSPDSNWENGEVRRSTPVVRRRWVAEETLH